MRTNPPRHRPPARLLRFSAAFFTTLQTPHRFDALLFDFGGVLIDYASGPRLLEWLNYSISPETLWRRWLLSPAVRAFESGKCSPEQFAADVVAEFSLPVNVADFLIEFAVWPRALMPGATDLLRSLRGRFQLASFSNTNTLHWKHVQSQFDLLEHFDFHFPSHITGRIKPDEDGFRHIVDALGCSAKQILFFDDNPLNIDGARAVGFEAVRVDGPDDIRRALAHYDIAVDWVREALVCSEARA